MPIKYCTICKKEVEEKRHIGIGTILLCLITYGIWLLVIPFYKKKCPICKTDNLATNPQFSYNYGHSKKGNNEIELSFEIDSEPEDEFVPIEKVLRQGKFIQVDDVFKAWTSGNLNKMLKAVSIKTNLIDRHFLLQLIVKETYKLRKKEKYRKLCIKHSEKHLLTRISQYGVSIKRRHWHIA